MDALFLWEIRAIVKKSVWKCRILEKTHHLIHLSFESADSNMENIKERKIKRGKVLEVSIFNGKIWIKKP